MVQNLFKFFSISLVSSSQPSFLVLIHLAGRKQLNFKTKIFLSEKITRFSDKIFGFQKIFFVFSIVTLLAPQAIALKHLCHNRALEDFRVRVNIGHCYYTGSWFQGAMVQILVGFLFGFCVMVVSLLLTT